ncbi:MAG TPA: tRNA (adenosine(37)-N6)-threonylcarbamoyltransferase complex dimerization subunit type 1 TsaB [Candidatus Saccharimonadales bacterium]|nr:tRNA (adenosine(37)-N6)-threonylcarbamoyltransferase complex dimerization subunit type 1 TsaB [Candidatus Saccharimonadales bacterium]
MTILTIRTDKPEAEIGLYVEGVQKAYETWHAHRALAETLHAKIADLLTRHGLSLQDLGGIACYKGPGSFTGLRIGLTVGNALAHGLQIPIGSETGAHWQEKAIQRFREGDYDILALPEYGADVHITPPKQ